MRAWASGSEALDWAVGGRRVLGAGLGSLREQVERGKMGCGGRRPKRERALAGSDTGESWAAGRRGREGLG